ncbi:hypothetical protein PC116_g18405 [Phytophthora cactorum]|uniref:Uncharacterized protein n=1 Tax=Phytophthora cactorum TaxID=29920 RepID=A0A8T0Z016_9STRA|nr:hypothetical protein PC113_g12438 [Phytophthora cactorum]KAG2895262.1 hypothetical protein PC114_g15551 [Phytophthora cactorum]KAG2906985.1 hypothetical protein PC115_g14080 [Phytophthora cactorum]KAG2921568.1 hypothetical protein PC117_g16178 [Phytophthora cactorum]KAG3005603.1 hypothetical protein PC119_g15254 [Phytophthora cactorum]
MLYALTRAFYIEVLQHLVLKVRPGALQTLSEASTSLSWAEQDQGGEGIAPESTGKQDRVEFVTLLIIGNQNTKKSQRR